MSNYSFVEVHLKSPRNVLCELCDETWEEVKVYYEYTVDHTFPDGAPRLIDHSALKCCLHRGNIVDWREE